MARFSSKETVFPALESSHRLSGMQHELCRNKTNHEANRSEWNPVAHTLVSPGLSRRGQH